MCCELGASLGRRKRDLREPRLLRPHLVGVGQAKFLRHASLPRCEIRRRDTFHAVDLDVERVAAGKSVLDPAGSKSMGYGSV